MTSEKIAGLPSELHVLEILGSNFYYSWNRSIREVFAAVDAGSWDRSGHNPITLLRKLSKERIEELRYDEKFQALLRDAVRTQLEYLDGGAGKWFATTYPSKGAREVEVAYFSMEFGIVSYLRIYSGGSECYPATI